jgi:uncharacterized protein (DUF2345 family)
LLAAADHIAVFVDREGLPLVANHQRAR